MSKTLKEQTLPKIGFIGLVLMGSRMARRLLESKHELYIYNRTREKGLELIKDGAIWKNSPKELAKEVDIIFSMLSTPEITALMAFGEFGFLENLKENSIWINTSSVNPHFAKACGEASSKYGINFIDAPVVGGIIPAEKGELLIYAAGDSKDIKRAESAFNALSKEVVVLDEHGLGSIIKMAYSMLRGVSIAMFSEAMNFGEALGVEKEKFIDTLLKSDMAAPFLKRKREAILNEDFSTHFPLKWLLKDLFLASIAAYDSNTPIPITHAAKELFTEAKLKGYGDLDYSAISKKENKQKED